MELLDVCPTPYEFENTVMGCDFLYPLAEDWDCQTFLLNRFTELMLGDIRTTQMEDYIKMFVHLPLHSLEEYLRAKHIYRQRNDIWGIDEMNQTRFDWYYTTACVIHDYVLSRDADSFIARLGELSEYSTTNTLPLL